MSPTVECCRDGRGMSMRHRAALVQVTTRHSSSSHWKSQTNCFLLLGLYVIFHSLPPSVFLSCLFSCLIWRIYTWASLWSTAYVLTLSHYDNNTTFHYAAALLGFHFFFSASGWWILSGTFSISIDLCLFSLKFLLHLLFLFYYLDKIHTVWLKDPPYYVINNLRHFRHVIPQVLSGPNTVDGK